MWRDRDHDFVDASSAEQLIEGRKLPHRCAAAAAFGEARLALVKYPNQMGTYTLLGEFRSEFLTNFTRSDDGHVFRQLATLSEAPRRLSREQAKSAQHD